jgi:hypothetical protein
MRCFANSLLQRGPPKVFVTTRNLQHLPVISWSNKILFALPLLFENFIRFFHHVYIKLFFVGKMAHLDSFSFVSAFETGSLFIFMPLLGLLIDRVKGGRFGRRYVW